MTASLHRASMLPAFSASNSRPSFRTAGIGIRASIIAQTRLSPKGLERKFGLVGGDIMHGNMSLDQLWAARPVLGNGGYRGPVKSLYMCGAGTHPGGGVTGAPGHNAAQVILRDRGFFAPRWR